MPPYGLITELTGIRKFLESFFIAIPTGSSFRIKEKCIADNIAYIV